MQTARARKLMYALQAGRLDGGRACVKAGGAVLLDATVTVRPELRGDLELEARYVAGWREGYHALQRDINPDAHRQQRIMDNTLIEDARACDLCGSEVN